MRDQHASFTRLRVPEHIPIRFDRVFIPGAFKWQNYHIKQSANVRSADPMHLLLSLPPHFTSLLLFSHLSCCVYNLEISNVHISTICAVLKSSTKALSWQTATVHI